MRYIFHLGFILICLWSQNAFAQGIFYAGAAEADITPAIAEFDDLNHNGRFDYGDPEKAFGFGDRVKSFVDGDILVGNGTGKALFVYDRLMAYAVVIKDPQTGKTVAFVSSDVYLLQGPDVQKIRSMVDEKYAIDYIVIAANHNHMGPDTLGAMGLADVPIPQIINILVETGRAPSGINSIWFEKYQRTVADCIETAAAQMVPAKIRFAKTDFNFGRIDTREPLILDPTLAVMAVDTVDGKPIATLMQWANHPEAVLTYGREGWENALIHYEDLTDLQKQAWGKVLTSGFCGYAREKMRALRGGGVPMYFNGAVGAMMTPLHARMWDPEKHPEYPMTTPPEKVPDELLIPYDFRFAPVLGRELAKAANDALEKNSTAADFTAISVAKTEVLVPMKNNIFRAAASLGIYGSGKDTLYDDQGKPDPEIGSWLGGVFLPGVEVQKGKNTRAELAVVNVGPAQFLSLPCEAVPESIAGFPDDFITNEDKYFPKNKDKHAHGADYKLSAPPLKTAATGDYLFVFGLSGGEMGYAIPGSDFSPPKDLRVPPFCWYWWICFDAETNPHYEESNSVGPDLEKVVMGEMYRLMKENPVQKGH